MQPASGAGARPRRRGIKALEKEAVELEAAGRTDDVAVMLDFIDRMKSERATGPATTIGTAATSADAPDAPADTDETDETDETDDDSAASSEGTGTEPRSSSRSTPTPDPAARRPRTDAPSGSTATTSTRWSASRNLTRSTHPSHGSSSAPWSLPLDGT